MFSESSSSPSSKLIYARGKKIYCFQHWSQLWKCLFTIFLGIAVEEAKVDRKKVFGET